jgi:hypothetical protein
VIARLLLFILLACPLAGWAQGPLSITDAYFEDYDRRIVRDQKLPAGETVYLSFRIAGFKVDEKSHVLLHWWVECDDPQGKPLAEVTTDKIDTSVSREDEKWRPKVDWSLVIPSYAPSGEYQALIRVRDDIASKETTSKMAFRVSGVNVEPSDKLVVRNFEYLESENGNVKPKALFTLPGTLWARFRIVGFRILEDKGLSVEVDLTILNSEGKAVFSRPQAAAEQMRVFYPPRFLTETFNVDLQKGIPSGEYTIRLEVRDLAGSQSAQYETKFTIT